MKNVKNTAGTIATNFRDNLFSNDLSNFKELNFVLGYLNSVKIKDGYGLDAFDCGWDTGYYLQPYCYDLEYVGYYQPASSYENRVGEYNDKLKIRNMLNPTEATSIPPILSYFIVPFTENGIMEAWLLDILSDFLPREWHAYYDYKEYFFNINDIELLFPKDLSSVPEFYRPFFRDRVELRDKVFAMPIEELLPSVTIEQDSAFISYVYWQDNKGLLRTVIPVVKDNNSVKFLKDKSVTTLLLNV